MRSLNLVMLPAMLALAACTEQAPERVEDAREAEGEVLGGSISDDMLPLDQLRSQSPILRETTVTTTEGEDGSTTVETTVETTSGEPGPPPPEPPRPRETSD
jgi:hypothetical protein